MTRPTSKVLVLGATGRIGAALVRLLTAAGVPVRAATRTPGVIPPDPCVEAAAFDFQTPLTFAPALCGIEQVFLIARPGDNHSDRAATPFVDEARRQGVQHIVNLTAMGVETEPAFSLRIIERYLENSGIAFTHLRPNWFMQNFGSGPMYADIMATGALHLPADNAGLSFIDADDIAAVAFAALMNPVHRNKAYTLTGGKALNHYEVMAEISRAANRTIPYVPLSEDDARRALLGARVPEPLVERWTMFFRKVRQGLCAPVSQDVEAILGRPPVTFQAYASAHGHLWQQRAPDNRSEEKTDTKG